MREVSVRMRVAEITHALRQVRLGAGSAFDDVLPAMSALLGIDSLLIYKLDESAHAWTLARWHQTGLPADLGCALQRFANTAPANVVFYDARRVLAGARNRVIEATAWVDREVPGTWRASPLATHVLAPAGLGGHRQYRALVCDGPEFLGWFGAFVAGELDARHLRLFASLVPAVRDRMIAERFLGPTLHLGGASALEACLDQVSAPAWIVRQRGVIVHRNAAAAPLGPIAVDDPRLERVSIAVAGMPEAWLVTLHLGDDDARITAAVARAALRWSLTPRQRMVLDHLAHGRSTTAIAALMAVTPRAIELHVTALLGRAGVDHRAALTAALLTLE